jgi:uncharacterized DUF497 family protein
MRFEFNPAKSRGVLKKHGPSLEEAQEIFGQVYVVDQKCDDPEQFRAIGWAKGSLHSVIYEIRVDAEGEYYRLITTWKSTEQEEQAHGEKIEPPFNGRRNRR